MEHWFTPPAIDTEPFAPVSQSSDRVVFRRSIELTNYSKTKLQLEATREVRLLPAASTLRAHKLTLPVRFEPDVVRTGYLVAALAAFAVIVAGVAGGLLPWPTLIALAAVPLVFRVHAGLKVHYDSPYTLMAVMGANVNLNLAVGGLLLAAAGAVRDDVIGHDIDLALGLVSRDRDQVVADVVAAVGDLGQALGQELAREATAQQVKDAGGPVFAKVEVARSSGAEGARWCGRAGTGRRAAIPVGRAAACAGAVAVIMYDVTVEDPAGCPRYPAAIVRGAREVLAAEVLRHDPLSVALVILHIEWMTQLHYVDSVKDDGDLDPLEAAALADDALDGAGAERRHVRARRSAFPPARRGT